LVQRLSERGVEHVLLFISDGLNGMTDALHRVYSKAKHQVCCVHVSRNIANKVRVKDRAAILDDFKAVYEAERCLESQNIMEQFQNIWLKTYPRAVNTVMNQDRILPFYDFSASIRPSIYATKLI